MPLPEPANPSLNYYDYRMRVEIYTWTGYRNEVLAQFLEEVVERAKRKGYPTPDPKQFPEIRGARQNIERQREFDGTVPDLIDCDETDPRAVYVTIKLAWTALKEDPHV